MRSPYDVYDPAINGRFREAAARHFEAQTIFKTVKRAVGEKAAP